MCLACHPSHHSERGRCPDCHRGNPASERRNIAHAGFISGKYARYTLGDTSYLNGVNRLVDLYSCRRCHISNGRGNRLAINLDAAAARKTAEELEVSIRNPVDNMPNFGLGSQQTILLVNAILAGSQRQKAGTGAPVAVHFSVAKNRNVDVLSRACGTCHRVLSERRGALGTGNIAPNLSGLLSTWYPKTFRNEYAWTFQNLKSWLKNPRAARPWTRMRPVVSLSGDELSELESILKVTSKPCDYQSDHDLY
ncbi:MAG: selenite/tellurite reduction operon c-type cytochrome lipoprotein ExtS [Desulfuromonadales bacterium]